MNRELPKASFAALVQLVAEQALVALGGPHPLIPADQLPPADPRVARFFVDLLGTLQERTRGNITAEEDRELDDVLYALRLRIVNLPHADSGPSGPPQGD